jgi:4-carboxymuconolactone decarboxylase
VEEAALDLARRLTSGRSVTDEEFHRLRTALGEGGLIEVSTLVGYYTTLAMQLALFDVSAPS